MCYYNPFAVAKNNVETACHISSKMSKIQSGSPH